jgi:hypothetical protein
MSQFWVGFANQGWINTFEIWCTKPTPFVCKAHYGVQGSLRCARLITVCKAHYGVQGSLRCARLITVSRIRAQFQVLASTIIQVCTSKPYFVSVWEDVWNSVLCRNWIGLDTSKHNCWLNVLYRILNRGASKFTLIHVECTGPGSPATLSKNSK